MRLRILRRVDFPAPFFPISPTTSASLREKLTSRRAKKSSLRSAFAVRKPRRTNSTSCSRRTLYAVASLPRRYFFQRPCATTISRISDHVRELPVGLVVVAQPHDEEDQGHGRSGDQPRHVQRIRAEQRPAEAVDDRHH